MLACGVVPQGCTDVGCDTEGLTSTVQFSLSGPGAYRFDVVVDGVAVRCSAPLPLREGEGGCDDGRVTLIQSGSMLPDDQQSLGPITVRGEGIRHIEVQAYRGQAPVGSAAFDVEHTESPGPNGPGCDPEVCRSASGGELR